MADEEKTEESEEEKSAEETEEKSEETIDDKVEKTDDWQAKSRKNEARAKRAEKKQRDLEAKLKEREDEDKSEQEKAIEKAREEAKAEALTEAQKDRRADRLEVAVTRLASKGLTIGEGDDAKTVRFADSEDALLHIERGIARGDIDADDIYDSEGKVNTDALTTELGELIKGRPHLAANGEKPAPGGDSDARKGEAEKADSLTADDHLKQISKRK